MSANRRVAGLTILELLATLLVVAAALAVAVPTIAGAKGDAGVQQSIDNLRTLGMAHVLYAADWDMRQVTWVKDDLGEFGGNVVAYNSAAGGCNIQFPPRSSASRASLRDTTATGLARGGTG